MQCFGFFIRRPRWTDSITSGPLIPGYGVDATHVQRTETYVQCMPGGRKKVMSSVKHKFPSKLACSLSDKCLTTWVNTIHFSWRILPCRQAKLHNFCNNFVFGNIVISASELFNPELAVTESRDRHNKHNTSSIHLRDNIVVILAGRPILPQYCPSRFLDSWGGGLV